MGYVLHITRRRDWSDPAGPEISFQEWLTHVRSDPELRMDASLGDDVTVWSGPSAHELPGLFWVDGNIETKYPDEALIRKMVAIATTLGGSVQGDDGERYDASGLTIAAPVPTKLQRLRRWWSNLLSPRLKPMNAAEVPFKVGDRVRDIFGNRSIGTITRIDLRAEHGMGLISVTYDDGRIVHGAAFAPGFEPVRSESTEP